MEIEQAIKEVSNIGAAYFYDEIDRYAPSEIIARIKQEILDATKLQGLHDSEITRDAFYMVLKNLEVKELNDIVENEYNLFPEKVGGGRVFFQRIADEMDAAIREVKPKLMGNK